MNWTDEVSSQWGLPETELRLILFARYEKKIISSLQAYNCSMQKKIQSSHRFFILLLLVFFSTFLENVDAFVFGAALLLTPVVVFFFQVMRSVVLAAEAATPLSSSSPSQRRQQWGRGVKTRPRLYDLHLIKPRLLNLLLTRRRPFSSHQSL